MKRDVPLLLDTLKELGIKRSSIARLIGVSPGNVYDWRIGRSYPEPENKKKLHEAINQIGKQLMYISLNNKNAKEQLESCGINIAWLSTRGRIIKVRSKQDFHEKLEKGIDHYPPFKKALEKYLSQSGKDLLAALIRHKRR